MWVDWMDWKSPGGVKYRAADLHSATKSSNSNDDSLYLDILIAVLYSQHWQHRSEEIHHDKRCTKYLLVTDKNKHPNLGIIRKSLGSFPNALRVFFLFFTYWAVRLSSGQLKTDTKGDTHWVFLCLFWVLPSPPFYQTVANMERRK